MKKKLILMLLFGIVSLSLLAPTYISEEDFKIPDLTPVNPFEPLIEAIVFVEVGDGSDLYNENEDAVGHFQIRPIRLNDYNRRTGKNYSLDQMYDYDIAKEVFMYYADSLQDWETIARRWNGSGPMTSTYWNKVKAYLDKNGVEF